ncbi:hypothetical protein T265_08301 [Opisthorchis viverrini]|uniref:Uncharacterized protein n=1 Tax=Opisthorchis viverrini TaxID=6198 RepID=A0A074Z9N1_OPIVI|nr:hypothetical protein T265_08301 [Opisthorchis viverrini]KER23941.1 hypothetical protein T265_08301 [Opisthorchis viverrini]
MGEVIDKLREWNLERIALLDRSLPIVPSEDVRASFLALTGLIEKTEFQPGIEENLLAAPVILYNPCRNAVDE